MQVSTETQQPRDARVDGEELPGHLRRGVHQFEVVEFEPGPDGASSEYTALERLRRLPLTRCDNVAEGIGRGREHCFNRLGIRAVPCIEIEPTPIQVPDFV